ncbi:Sorting nexin mvp1 [Dissophora globulifera]|uniref:Sorting nexin mvp1 n=1 Tax=Dissophora globulifera TaxID=979702 RepID=A0A9P6UU42_9FUNG|nr:Sorting nexin mvp1 [Dissophora globulifera]
MSAIEDSHETLTASFSASTFDSEVNGPWTAPGQGVSPDELSAVLSGVALPAIYSMAFDMAQPSGGKITVLAMNKIMGVSGLPPAMVEKIMNIVVAPTRSRVTKSEVSVALALVAMAQKNMDVSIENLTAHREASPPNPSADSTTGSSDPEAVRKEIHQWFINLDTIRLSFAPEREGMFLFKHTNYIVESKELALWRKNVVISTEDEFTSQLPIPSDLAKQVPLTLETQLSVIRKRLPASIEYYRSMAIIMDRMQKRTEAAAADYTRFGLALNALADCERQCYVEECHNCQQLSQGYTKIASHFGQASFALEEQGKAIQREMVEDLKRHRDLLVSVKELLQRHDRSREAGTIEALQKRISNNMTKLDTLKEAAMAAASAAGAANDTNSALDYGAHDMQIEKITNNLYTDRMELEVQKQRAVLLEYTLWIEITYFHKNQAMITTMYQNFVTEHCKTGRSLNDTWKSLSRVVHDMPMEVNGFK